MELKDNMNRIITTMAVMLIVSCMTAQKTQMIVNVKQPGTLADCIGEKNIMSVERLTIKGLLNAADVILLRLMAGRDTEGKEINGGKLSYLNLQKASFVADTICFVRNQDYQANLGEGGVDLPDQIFWGCRLKDLVFPDGIRRIGKYALSRTKMSSIVLPENVSLERCAFYECKELTHVTFPKKLKKMGDAPFYGCEKLERIDINNIEVLGGHSFRQMKSLKKVNINGWCIHSDGFLFYDCPELETVDFRGELISSGGALVATRCPKLETVTFHAPVYATYFGMNDSCFAFKGFFAKDIVIESGFREMIPASPKDTIIARYDSLVSNLAKYKNNQIPAFWTGIAERKLNDIAYDLACNYALDNDKERALDWFEKVVTNGMRNYYHFLKDPDLNNIRNEARFQAIMADLKATEEKVNKLKLSAEYDSNGRKANVIFTYQSPSDSLLTAIREYFNLDSIAGNGNEISRIKRIMYWLHDAIRHDGNSPWPKCRYNAIELYELTQRDNRGLNCRFMAEVLNDLYLAAGFKSRFVTCQSKEYDIDNDCHVINIVWSQELGKWIWMDPTFCAYVTDENGLLLHPGEVRERLRKDKPVILNEDANWNHKTPQTKDYYIDYYMAKNLYLLSSHECSESESESKNSNKTPSVTLVPHGFDYMVDKVTEDYAEFWQRP